MAKASRANTQPSVEELVALLKKTALPTVVCEGSDDLIIYRRLEDRLAHLGVSILPAGGRRNVLQVFERRKELPANVQVAFLADLDTWVNVGVPQPYITSSLIFTDGYSIENDVYCDGNFECLLTGPEVALYQADLDDFVHWYALALKRHLADPTKPIKTHPKQVLDPAQRAALLAMELDEVYPQDIKIKLLANYNRLVRGKSLLGLLLKNTNSRPGQPFHTDRSLLEMVAARPGPKMARLSSAIEAIFIA